MAEKDHLEEIKRILLDKNYPNKDKTFTEIQSYIKNVARNTGVSPQRILEIFKDKEALIQHVLNKKEAPSLIPWRKIFGMMLFSGILLLIVIVYLFFHSITPIFKYDSSSGTLAFFGKEYRVDRIQNIKTEFLDKLDQEKLTVKLEGDMSGENIQRIVIEGNSLDLTLQSGGQGMRYKCETEAVKKDFITFEDNSLKLTLDSISRCDFTVKAGIPISADIQNGVLKLKKIDQDLDIKFNNGAVIWSLPNRQDFNIQTIFTNVDIMGDPITKDTSKASWSAVFSIENGLFYLGR